MRALYKNKQTQQVIIADEKPEGEHWELIKEIKTMDIKNGMIKSNKILKK